MQYAKVRPPQPSVRFWVDIRVYSPTIEAQLWEEPRETETNKREEEGRS